ncbi:biotin transporter BioY [Corynebacterium aquilae]|uniref:Biotin transporter n=1 Tax=Corynebacterium aquilae DSM 44791 TaxID=1431546 RepID=A0A1L7CGQ4_9CORY|nr:biotin transporter BioY [Corynebacterium aquilae]APT84933.1 hypothetical protein CAQU_07485 [Corynebacterium aquilae DSM 44791]
MNKSTQRTIATVAVFAALIIASGLVSIPSPVGGVPIVLQNAFCVLAGLILGPKRGFYAVLAFFTLGLIGIPVLPGGRSILAALPGPSGGYLIGYLVSPLIAGAVSAPFLARRSKGALAAGAAIASIAAILAQYVFGVIGLVWRVGQTLGAAITAQAAFLPGMAIKVVLLTLVTVAVLRALPDTRTAAARG